MSRLRILSVLVCASLGITVLGDEAPHQAKIPPAVQARFVGAWCNNDFNTRENTRILIYIDGENLKVHMWGRCHPTECDWGEVTATAAPNDGNSISLVWNKGFAVKTQMLTLDVDGSLTLSGKTVFTDKSGRKPLANHGVFLNGLRHDWADYLGTSLDDVNCARGESHTGTPPATKDVYCVLMSSIPHSQPPPSGCAVNPLPSNFMRHPWAWLRPACVPSA